MEYVGKNGHCDFEIADVDTDGDGFTDSEDALVTPTSGQILTEWSR